MEREAFGFKSSAPGLASKLASLARRSHVWKKDTCVKDLGKDVEGKDVVGQRCGGKGSGETNAKQSMKIWREIWRVCV